MKRNAAFPMLFTREYMLPVYQALRQATPLASRMVYLVVTAHILRDGAKVFPSGEKF